VVQLPVPGVPPVRRRGVCGCGDLAAQLLARPQGDMSRPLTGVFSTCSPNRPNPIGLHRARIVARDGLRIELDALEAIDGTPVVDVKPAIDPPARRPARGGLARRLIRPGP
jgi:tRNA (Thr-GGU) A37 N-methylase